MTNSKFKFVIVAVLAMGLSLNSCGNKTKDGKENPESNSMEHSSEMMEGEDHSQMNHDNSDGHHDEETMTHDNSDGHHHEAEGANSSARDIEANTQKNAATSAIVDAYILIKNALVNDDSKKAAEGGNALLTAISNFDMTKLSESQHKEYMDIIESAKEQAEHIVKNPIDHQREHFETLSTDVTDLIALLGTNKTLYQDYCPMKKVSWLSETQNIKNPFYGSKMLTCGNVKKQIN